MTKTLSALALCALAATWAPRTQAELLPSVSSVLPAAGAAPSYTTGTEEPLSATAGSPIQLNVKSAASPNMFFSVWEENDDPQGFFRSLKGSRVALDGRRIDDIPILLRTRLSGYVASSVTWDGNSFVVVFNDVTPGQQTVGFVSTVQAIRVAESGLILDPQPIVFSYVALGEGAAAGGDRQTLVTWKEFRGGLPEVVAARMASDGTLLDRSPLQISRSNFGVTSPPAVVRAGERYLVAWSQAMVPVLGCQLSTCPGPAEVDIFAMPVTSTGIVDPAPIEIATEPGVQMVQRLAAGPDRFLISYRSSSDEPRTFRFKEILGDGQIRHGSAEEPGLSVASPNTPPLELWWNGSRFIAAFMVTTSNSGEFTADVDIMAVESNPAGSSLVASASSRLSLPQRLTNFSIAPLPTGAFGLFYVRMTPEDIYVSVYRAFMTVARPATVSQRRRATNR